MWYSGQALADGTIYIAPPGRRTLFWLWDEGTVRAPVIHYKVAPPSAPEPKERSIYCNSYGAPFIPEAQRWSSVKRDAWLDEVDQEGLRPYPSDVGLLMDKRSLRSLR